MKSSSYDTAADTSFVAVRAFNPSVYSGSSSFSNNELPVGAVTVNSKELCICIAHRDTMYEHVYGNINNGG